MAIVVLSVLAIYSLVGCANKNSDSDKDKNKNISATSTENSDKSNNQSSTVTLKFWCDENEVPMFQQRIDQFIEENKAQASIEVTCEPIGASTCKDTFLADTNNGADVFCMPDDQLLAMAAAGILEEIPDTDKISKRNLEGATDAASVDGKLYAYPLTADNGYFLYYDKRYFKERDVQTLDSILDICARNNKKFAMSWTSGWYMYSFFGNTGLKMGVNEDGLTNFCEWNAKKGKITGIDIAQALLDIAKHKGFIEANDSKRVTLVQKGKVIAAVSGIWDAATMTKAFGGEYGACKLPTYTCAGKQVQMSSFTGYRLLGVNSYSVNKEWAYKLADFLSGEKSQTFF